MLKISCLSPITYSNRSYRKNIQKTSNETEVSSLAQVRNTSPIYYTPNFKARIVKDIAHNSYLKLPEEAKSVYRMAYENFYKSINIDELFWPKNRSLSSKLPLYTEEDMQEFLKIAKSYNKYRDNENGERGNKIICLGRSPKWFLNASLWMKGGIQDYIFTAFSSNWYSRDRYGVGPKLWRKNDAEPTIEQAFMYKKYLERIGSTPKDIVRYVEETQKPVIVTDYIHSGCGVTSWLDLMSKYAKDDGVLDEFAKGIRLHTMSSDDYIDNVLGYENAFVHPKIILPERLQKYDIPQDYHDMSSSVLLDMLIDKNTNECRSTFYPPKAWTMYSPDKFQIAQNNMTEEDIREAYRYQKKMGGVFPDMSVWTDAMRDYRNLMNFRILDYLERHGMLDTRDIDD